MGSERTPITGELRRAMVEGNYHFDGHHIVREELAIGRERFYGLCDAIDAVHAALEDESAGLRERLARLDKRDDYMHDGWVELPKDADGEYIHIGDVVEPNGANSLFGQASFEVRAMRCDEGGWEVYDRLGGRYAPSLLRHHHAPTVEDVLRDFGVDIAHALDADPDATVPEATIAEYAAKLRLAGDAE